MSVADVAFSTTGVPAESLALLDIAGVLAEVVAVVDANRGENLRGPELRAGRTALNAVSFCPINLDRN